MYKILYLINEGESTMKLKKISMMGLTALMILSMLGCGKETATTTKAVTKETKPGITLTFGHVIAEGTPLDKGAHFFADKVSEKSKGRIKVEIYANSALGDNRAMIESLQMGSLDMMSPAVAALGGFTNSTLLFDLPYLFKNDAHAEAVLDGEIGQDIFKQLEKAKIVGLTWMFQGWRELSTSKGEVHKPEDLKGLKIRTQNNEIQLATWNNWGASAVPMAYSEVFTALQQGVLDAQENPVSNIFLSGFYEVQKYIVKTDHIYDPLPVIVSKISWDKLSSEDQKIIREAAKEAATYERKITNQMDAEYQKKISESGKCKVVILTPEEKAAFKVASKAIYDKYAAKIGQDRIDKVAKIGEKF